MDAGKEKRETGISSPKVWVTRSLYALDASNKYFEVLTYKVNDEKESCVGQIIELAEKPRESYSNCFICLGEKAIIPIDNTRCGFEHKTKSIVFMKDLMRSKIARVREDIESGKRYRFFLTNTVDPPTNETNAKNEEMFSKHFSMYDELKAPGKKGKEKLPIVRNQSDEGTKSSELIKPSPKPIEKKKANLKVDVDTIRKDTYQAFIAKCMTFMKLETVSVMPENAEIHSDFANLEGIPLFNKLVEHCSVKEKVTLNIEAIATLEFTKLMLGPGVKVIVFNKKLITKSLN